MEVCIGVLTIEAFTAFVIEPRLEERGDFLGPIFLRSSVPFRVFVTGSLDKGVGDKVSVPGEEKGET
jgi:hypothetical protein